MEISLDNLIDLLLEAKRKTEPNGSATVYIGHPDCSGADEDNLCLCAEETYHGTNVHLFNIVVPTENVESCIGRLVLGENLASDLKAAREGR